MNQRSRSSLTKLLTSLTFLGLIKMLDLVFVDVMNVRLSVVHVNELTFVCYEGH